MPEDKDKAVIVRSILSFIAILAVIGLGFYESTTNTKVNDFVYWILGGAVFRLNASDMSQVFGFFKKKM